jgi:hypothetical protein
MYSPVGPINIPEELAPIPLSLVEPGSTFKWGKNAFLKVALPQEIAGALYKEVPPELQGRTSWGVNLVTGGMYSFSSETAVFLLHCKVSSEAVRLSGVFLAKAEERT